MKRDVNVKARVKIALEAHYAQRRRGMGKKRMYSELTEAEKKALDEKFPPIPRPKLTIETGVFAPFVRLLSRLGLCRMKEKYQAAHPEYNVRYDYEV